MSQESLAGIVDNVKLRDSPIGKRRNEKMEQALKLE
jgi:hypothetical protein